MSRKIKWVFAIVMVLSVVIIAQATAINNYYLPTVYVGPTLTPTPTPTQKPSSGCMAQDLLGTKVNVCFTDIEPKPTASPLDEWVKIKNIGNNTAEMEGWRISSDTGNKYDFPAFTLKVGQTVTVWTKTGSDSSSVLYMNRTEEFWKDNKDCGYLKDSSDPRNTKDSFCYESAGLFAPAGE
jgi:hypothetical protein